MIVEAFVSILAAMLGGLGALFGNFHLPGWWTDATDGISWLLLQGAGFGYWFPMGSVGRAITFLLVAIGIAITIRLLRIVLSLFTAGGGSAG